jgi:ArsR family transcriptional regulator, arsenate/arsenite/antimonite-responsive transcriptional repressor
MPKSCSMCFKALGVPSRLKIYKYLAENGKSTVSDVVKVVKLTQPTVSYHLKEMKELGLLANSRVGKEVYYRVNPICHTFGDDCLLNNLKFKVS